MIKLFKNKRIKKIPSLQSGGSFNVSKPIVFEPDKIQPTDYSRLFSAADIRKQMQAQRASQAQDKPIKPLDVPDGAMFAGDKEWLMNEYSKYLTDFYAQTTNQGRVDASNRFWSRTSRQSQKFLNDKDLYDYATRDRNEATDRNENIAKGNAFGVAKKGQKNVEWVSPFDYAVGINDGSLVGVTVGDLSMYRNDPANVGRSDLTAGVLSMGARENIAKTARDIVLGKTKSTISQITGGDPTALNNALNATNQIAADSGVDRTQVWTVVKREMGNAASKADANVYKNKITDLDKDIADLRSKGSSITASEAFQLNRKIEARNVLSNVLKHLPNLKSTNAFQIEEAKESFFDNLSPDNQLVLTRQAEQNLANSPHIMQDIIKRFGALNVKANKDKAESYFNKLVDIERNSIINKMFAGRADYETFSSSEDRYNLYTSQGKGDGSGSGRSGGNKGISVLNAELKGLTGEVETIERKTNMGYLIDKVLTSGLISKDMGDRLKVIRNILSTKENVRTETGTPLTAITGDDGDLTTDGSKARLFSDEQLSSFMDVDKTTNAAGEVVPESMIDGGQIIMADKYAGKNGHHSMKVTGYQDKNTGLYVPDAALHIIKNKGSLNNSTTEANENIVTTVTGVEGKDILTYNEYDKGKPNVLYVGLTAFASPLEFLKLNEKNFSDSEKQDIENISESIKRAITDGRAPDGSSFNETLKSILSHPTLGPKYVDYINEGIMKIPSKDNIVDSDLAANVLASFLEETYDRNLPNKSQFDFFLNNVNVRKTKTLEGRKKLAKDIIAYLGWGNTSGLTDDEIAHFNQPAIKGMWETTVKPTVTANIIQMSLDATSIGDDLQYAQFVTGLAIVEGHNTAWISQGDAEKEIDNFLEGIEKLEGNERQIPKSVAKIIQAQAIYYSVPKDERSIKFGDISSDFTNKVLGKREDIIGAHNPAVSINNNKAWLRDAPYHVMQFYTPLRTEFYQTTGAGNDVTVNRSVFDIANILLVQGKQDVKQSNVKPRTIIEDEEDFTD